MIGPFPLELEKFKFDLIKMHNLELEENIKEIDFILTKNLNMKVFHC